jgi:hypothetical protein
MKESTHPRVTGKDNLAAQQWRMSVRVTGVLFSQFLVSQVKISASQPGAPARCRPCCFGESEPFLRAARILGREQLNARFNESILISISNSVRPNWKHETFDRHEIVIREELGLFGGGEIWFAGRITGEPFPELVKGN